MGLIDTHTKPLCPAGFAPVSAEHQMYKRLFDVAYGAATKDADGEWSTESAAILGALSDIDTMRLHMEGTGTLIVSGGLASVESWYWRCRLCGLMLPAGPPVPVQRPPR